MTYRDPDQLLPIRAFRTLTGRPSGRLLTLEGKDSKSAPTTNYTKAAQDAAKVSKDTALFNTALNRPTQTTPYGTTSWSLRPGADPNNPKPGDWTQTTSLSKGQQGLLDANTETSMALARLARQGTGSVGASFAKPLDTSGLPDAPQASMPTDPTVFAQQRAEAQDAQYDRATQYYDERFGRDESQLRTRLLNQGLNEGSEAYGNALREFSQNKNTAYADAADRAVAAGGTEQSRMLTDLANAMQTQQGLRNNSLQEAVTLRELPINELNALRSGTQVTPPTFTPFSPSQGAQSPDLLNASIAQGNQSTSNWNAQQAASASRYGTLGSLLAAGLLAY